MPDTTDADLQKTNRLPLMPIIPWGYRPGLLVERIARVRDDPAYVQALAESRQRASSDRHLVESRRVIEFYSNSGFGGTFSNCSMWPVPYTVPDDPSASLTALPDEQIQFASSEHMFQTAKYSQLSDSNIQDWIARTQPTGSTLTVDGVRRRLACHVNVMMEARPSQCAVMGRTRELPIRSDWEQVRDRVMYYALNLKFAYNDTCAAALVANPNAVIIERAPRDAYWAINDNGVGENMLGILLMLIREDLLNYNPSV